MVAQLVDLKAWMMAKNWDTSMVLNLAMMLVSMSMEQKLEQTSGFPMVEKLEPTMEHSRE